MRLFGFSVVALLLASCASGPLFGAYKVSSTSWNQCLDRISADISSPPGAPCDAADVSLIRLVANPQDFSGKSVSVAGVLRIEFESLYLYDSREHYAMRLSEFAVPVSIERLGDYWSDLHNMSGYYVKAVGVYELASPTDPEPVTSSSDPAAGKLVLDLVFVL